MPKKGKGYPTYWPHIRIMCSCNANAGRVVGIGVNALARAKELGETRCGICRKVSSFEEVS